MRRALRARGDGPGREERLSGGGRPRGLRRAAAGLVSSLNQWPGVKSDPRGYTGSPIIARRPDVFFRKDGAMPEAVEVDLTVPEAFDELTGHQFGSHLAAGLKARIAELVADRKAAGKGFLGAAAVLAQNPFDVPRSEEDRRGRLNPTVACRDKWKRVEVLQQVKAFQDAYREAWLEFKNKTKNVVFPAGTYRMVRHAGCPTVLV